MPNLIRKLFLFSEEKKIAKEIAERIENKISAKIMTEKRNILSANKISQHLEFALQIASEFKKEKKPGIFRRAVIANTLKWELINKKFPDDFIEVVVESCIFELTKK